MKKLKEELKYGKKGITLISLVVTIIVLLILAGVSIATLTGQNGILTQATKAKEETQQAKDEELRRLTALEAATNLETKTIIDKSTGKDVPVTIPAGFAVSQVEGENTVKDGLVVIDSKGNEFVWIPVENAIATDTTEANNNKSMALLNSSTKNYSGVMYDFTVGEDNSITSNVRTTNYFEPRLSTWNDTDETLSKYGYASKEQFLETMQTEYNNMADSVNTNKGFYIARYETSVDENGNVQSKKGVLPWSGNWIKWYNLYEKQKTFNSSSVQSSMIWGSQYDAMLNWVISNKNNNLLGISRDETGKVACGSNEKDVINNIYDLTGNTFEWTLTSGAQLNARMRKGGDFQNVGNASTRGYTNSGYSGDANGSRMTLYIK